MKRRDLRPELEAMAEGRTLANQFATKGSIVDPAVMEEHQSAFAAWARFSKTAAGEPLAAPAELLVPLP